MQGPENRGQEAEDIGRKDARSRYRAQKAEDRTQGEGMERKKRRIGISGRQDVRTGRQDRRTGRKHLNRGRKGTKYGNKCIERSKTEG